MRKAQITGSREYVRFHSSKHDLISAFYGFINDQMREICV